MCERVSEREIGRKRKKELECFREKIRSKIMVQYFAR